MVFCQTGKFLLPAVTPVDMNITQNTQQSFGLKNFTPLLGSSGGSPEIAVLVETSDKELNTVKISQPRSSPMKKHLITRT